MGYYVHKYENASEILCRIFNINAYELLSTDEAFEFERRSSG